MIVLLPWIIQNIQKAVAIGLPIRHIWLLMNFFCGVEKYLKDQVYYPNSANYSGLEQHISAACENIPALALARAYTNFVLRLQYVVTKHGGYTENIVI